jgi:hypothetical protein
MTARLHGADERRYLEWLLRELARREWSAAAAARLLPEAWLAAQEKKAEEAKPAEVKPEVPAAEVKPAEVAPAAEVKPAEAAPAAKP